MKRTSPHLGTGLLKRLAHPITSFRGSISRPRVSPIPADPVPAPLPTSLLDNVPHETLGEIFEWTKSISEDFKPGKIARNKDMSTIITHVCSQWRNIALAIPSLWADIVIENGTHSDKILTWLARSGPKAPLTLRMHLSRRRTQLNTLFLDHLHQFTDIQCEGTSDVVAHFLSLIHGRRAPELERLVVVEEMTLWSSAWFEETTPESKRVTAPFGDPEFVPTLKCLTVDGAALAWGDHPFENLTSLTLQRLPAYSRPTTDQLVTLLKSCPLLTYLSLGIYPFTSNTNDSEEQPHQEPIPLLRLDCLKLSAWGSLHDIYRLLRWIFVPNLKTLGLGISSRIQGQRDALEFDILLQSLNAGIAFDDGVGWTTLERLNLENVRCNSSDDLRRFLCRLPSLRVLHLNFSKLNINTVQLYLEAFKPSREMDDVGTVIPCPSLNTLEGEKLPSAFISTFLQDRTAEDHSIKYLKWCSTDKYALSKVQEWESLGVEVGRIRRSRL